MSEQPEPEPYDPVEPPPRVYSGDLPPQDMNAERAVLGSMLLAKEAIEDVIAVARPEDHYAPAHEVIHDVVVAMYGDGQPVDLLTVSNELDKRNLLGRVGGGLYLHSLVAETPVTANASHYAEIVRDKAILRRLSDAATRIRQMAHSGTDSTTDIVDAAHAELLAAVPRSATEDYRLVADVLDDSVDEIEATGQREGASGVPTGFYDLDDLTGGWLPGQMITVAGRPGMGKSTLALDFARAAAIRNRLPTVVYSLEMTRHEIITRLIAAESKVPLANLRNGHLSDADWSKVALGCNPISQSPLYVDDSANLTMTEIRLKSRRLKMQAGSLGLIVIDYLQLMSSGKRTENRQVEVSEFSRQIKLLAKELEVPIIALSQLNRGPEQRTSKRPLMSDLRESGSIEQDSDLVILMHREDAYEQESVRPGEADLIVAKHRNGPTRDIAVAAQLHYSRFADLSRV